MLGQWVAYTPSAVGVSVGFEARYLREQQFASVRRVVYKRDAQRKIVRGALNNLAPAVEEAFIAGDEALALRRGVVLGYIVQICNLCFKDPALANELEWRAIMMRPKEKRKVASYRVGGAAIVPYVTFPIAEGQKLKIVRLVLGPGLDRARNEHSIGGLLTKHGLRITAEGSRVPYRTVK